MDNKFGLHPADFKVHTIGLNNGIKKTGLFVDEIKEIVMVSESDINPPHLSATTFDKEGTARFYKKSIRGLTRKWLPELTIKTHRS